MAIDEIDFKMLERTVAKLEADSREQFGLIKEMAGRIKEVRDTQSLMLQLQELRTTDREHSAAIATVAEGVERIREAMAQSDDANLASAAQGITINLDAATKIDQKLGDVSGDANTSVTENNGG